MARNLTVETDYVSSKSLTARYSFNKASRLLAVNIDVLLPGPADDKEARPIHEAVKKVFNLPEFSDTKNTFELPLPEGIEPKAWLKAMLDGVESCLLLDATYNFLD